VSGRRARKLLLATLALPAFATAADSPSLELDTTAIRGSDELPQVLHILPWQSAEAAALQGRPLRSLVNEVLAPLDREVHRRELDYFEQLRSGPAAIAGARTQETDPR
jgi:hypothetical protein